MNTYPDIDYCFPKEELFNLLEKTIEIGKQIGKQESGKNPKYVSKREAGRLFKISRVNSNFVLHLFSLIMGFIVGIIYVILRTLNIKTITLN